ncbi:hypothetical protein ACRZ5S_22950 (plasmid) [Vibrio scophthalmi]|uniref:hypothetical protein n=1 Tax=Vibrio scophthalmi TaxID=45658 RepID=UPI003EB826AC
MYVKTPSEFTVKLPLMKFFQSCSVCLSLIMAYVCLFNLSYGFVPPWIELLVLIVLSVLLCWEQSIAVGENSIETKLVHVLLKRWSLCYRWYPRKTLSQVEVKPNPFGYLAWYDREQSDEPLFYSGSFIDNQL